MSDGLEVFKEECSNCKFINVFYNNCYFVIGLDFKSKVHLMTIEILFGNKLDFIPRMFYYFRYEVNLYFTLSEMHIY